MRISVESPTKAYVTEIDGDELADLKKALTYTNTGVQHLLKRHYANHFLKSRNPVYWEARLNELKADLKKTLVFEDDRGNYIRPGSIHYLGGLQFELVNHIKYPGLKRLMWQKPIPFDLHPYQITSVEKLIAEKTGNVSLTTGSGKSAIILKICQQMGLRTAVITPSRSIFRELKGKFEYHFGKGKIGAFGDGKKKLDKLITICIGDSIANIEPNTPEYDFFSKVEVLIVDESHTFAAESLEKICHDVLGKIPYRFFLSATQVRGDGTLPLLQSIIGKTVETLNTFEAVQRGYISPHEFKIVKIDSSNPNFQSGDALEMKRNHFLRNSNIASFITRLVQASATKGEQTLVLVEELSQIAVLLSAFKDRAAIAHSESSAAKLAEVGLYKVDVQDSIEKFNKHEVDVLIGTSCIRTGCNIFPVHHCVNWVGGASEIATKQGAVGRAIRFGKSNPWQSKCEPKLMATIWDFDVNGIHTMKRHLDERLEYYAESGTEIKHISFRKS